MSDGFTSHWRILDIHKKVLVVASIGAAVSDFVCLLSTEELPQLVVARLLATNSDVRVCTPSFQHVVVTNYTMLSCISFAFCLLSSNHNFSLLINPTISLLDSTASLLPFSTQMVRPLQHSAPFLQLYTPNFVESNPSRYLGANRCKN